MEIPPMPQRPHPRLICDSCGAESRDGNPIKHDSWMCLNFMKFYWFVIFVSVLLFSIGLFSK
jgi:hypothetical protein